MRRLGKSGWVVGLIAFVLLAPLLVEVGQAGNETYPADATTTTLALSGRYISQTASTAAGRDTTVASFNGQNINGILIADLSSIPSTDAVIAAYVNVVANKNQTTVVQYLRRICADVDSAQVSWVNAGDSAWAAPGARTTVPNWDPNGVSGDTLAISYAFDVVEYPSDQHNSATTLTLAGETIRFDVTDDVRRKHAGVFTVPLAWWFGNSDTTSTSGHSINWTANATAALRPKLTVVHGPVSSATGSGGNVIGQSGIGTN